jgi:hypothetical protein
LELIIPKPDKPIAPTIIEVEELQQTLSPKSQTSNTDSQAIKPKTNKSKEQQAIEQELA